MEWNRVFGDERSAVNERRTKKMQTQSTENDVSKNIHMLANLTTLRYPIILTFHSNKINLKYEYTNAFSLKKGVLPM